MGKRQQSFEKRPSNNYQHGHRNSRDGLPSHAYGSWQSMKARVLKGTSKYHYYGMEMEKDWENFIQFLSDVGEPPDRSYTLDRKDTNKGYIRGNVRWATKAEQSKNRINTIYVGDLCLKDWCIVNKLKYKSVHRWYKQGFTTDEILEKGAKLWGKDQQDLRKDREIFIAQ